MKKLIQVLFLAVFISSYSQVSNGRITYKVTVIDENNDKDKIIKGAFPNCFESIKNFDFILSYNDEKSFFEINETYKKNITNEINFARMKCGYPGEILKINDTIFNFNAGQYLEKNLILKKAKVNDWVLLNETKVIDGYLCYKATTEDVIVGRDRTIRKPITAWYCPKLNYSYGPLGYNGLPGLILELQTRDAVYGVSKIELDLKESLKFPDITSGKIVSDKDMSLMVQKLRESMRN